MMETIVVGVDGSDGSRVALAWAAKEAQRRGDRLELVHAWQLASGAGPFSNEMAVFTSEEVEAAAQHLLTTLVAEARATAGEGVEVVGETVCGSPGVELVSRSHEASMVVVGSRGLGGLGGLLLGSVSRQVVHHAHCPVVVVPHPERSHEAPAA